MTLKMLCVHRLARFSKQKDEMSFSRKRGRKVWCNGARQAVWGRGGRDIGEDYDRCLLHLCLIHSQAFIFHLKENE